MLKRHFELKPVIIAERFRFHRWDQSSGESIVEDLAKMCHLATHCQFSDYLNKALRDQFVCGLQNGGMQKRLLSKKEPLPLKKAVELALATVADKNYKVQPAPN